MAKKSFFKKAKKGGKKKKAQKKKLDAEDKIHKNIDKKKRELEKLEKAIAKQDKKAALVTEETGDAKPIIAKSAYEQLMEKFSAENPTEEESRDDEEDSEMPEEEELTQEDMDDERETSGELNAEEMDMVDEEDSDENDSETDEEKLEEKVKAAEKAANKVELHGEEDESEDEDVVEGAIEATTSYPTSSHDFFRSYTGRLKEKLIPNTDSRPKRSKTNFFGRGVVLTYDDVKRYDSKADANLSLENLAVVAEGKKSDGTKQTALPKKKLDKCLATMKNTYLPLLKGKATFYADQIPPEQLPCHFQFLHHLNTYRDVAIPSHSAETSMNVRSACMAHVANHVLKAREVCVRNNTIVQMEEDGKSFTDVDEDMRLDRGFCRVRVVILCSFRSVAHELVNMLINLCPNATQVINRSKFEEQYAPGVAYTEENPDGGMSKKTLTDLEHVFSGHSDDKFRMGISVVRKAMKLFTPFYQSDILVCSPLGLKLMCEDDSDFLSSCEMLIIDRADVLKMQNFEHVKSCLEKMNIKPKTLPKECDITRLRPCFTFDESRAFRQTIVTSNGMSSDVNGLFIDDLSDGTRKDEPSSKKRRNFDTTGLESEDPLAVSGVAKTRNYRGIAKLLDFYPEDAIKKGSELGVSRQMFLVADNSVSSSVSSKGSDLDAKTQAQTKRSRQDAFFESLTTQNKDEEDQNALLNASSLSETFKKGFWSVMGSDLPFLVIVVSGCGYNYSNYLGIRRFLKDEFVDYLCIDEFMEYSRVKETRIAFNRGEVRVLLVTERFLFYHHKFDIQECENIVFVGAPERKESYIQGLSWISPFNERKGKTKKVTAKSQGGEDCPKANAGINTVLTIIDKEQEAYKIERILGTDFVKSKLKNAKPNKIFTFNA